MQQSAMLRKDGGSWYHPYLYAKRNTGECDGMCAYFFAKKWQGRAIDVHGLQRVVIRSGFAKAAYLFARDIEGANIRRLQRIIMDSGSADQKRQFARDIPGAAVQHLEALAIIQEVMEL